MHEKRAKLLIYRERGDAELNAESSRRKARRKRAAEERQAGRMVLFALRRGTSELQKQKRRTGARLNFSEEMRKNTKKTRRTAEECRSRRRQRAGR